jgi:mono/diheme cytochrome c family protein
MESFARLSVALALAGALVACANNSGSASSSSSAAASSEASASAPPVASPAVAQNAATASDGARIYNQNCSSCHQPNGQGVQGTFPPLAGNPAVTGDAAHVTHIVKYGLSGRITVAGVAYNGLMPAWGQSLSNADIASVLTYVRSAWDNKAPPISESQVAGVPKNMQ